MNQQERQALFEKAVNGLLKQDGPATAGISGGCVLFTEGGRRCAIGHLIPSRWKNKIIRDGNQGCGSTVLLSAYPQLRKLFNVHRNSDKLFLGRMQYDLHDSQDDTSIEEIEAYGGWREWVRAKAIGFAARHKLNTKFLRKH